MFRRKPVITATYCTQMEKLRWAMEVLTGERAVIAHIDFNTELASVVVGGKDLNVRFTLVRSDLMYISRLDQHYRHNADFARPGLVRVIAFDGPRPETWIVGRSATERWEEPLYPSQS